MKQSERREKAYDEKKIPKNLKEGMRILKVLSIKINHVELRAYYIALILLTDRSHWKK